MSLGNTIFANTINYIEYPSIDPKIITDSYAKSHEIMDVLQTHLGDPYPRDGHGHSNIPKQDKQVIRKKHNALIKKINELWNYIVSRYLYLERIEDQEKEYKLLPNFKIMIFYMKQNYDLYFNYLETLYKGKKIFEFSKICYDRFSFKRAFGELLNGLLDTSKSIYINQVNIAGGIEWIEQQATTWVPSGNQGVGKNPGHATRRTRGDQYTGEGLTKYFGQFMSTLLDRILYIKRLLSLKFFIDEQQPRLDLSCYEKVYLSQLPENKFWVPQIRLNEFNEMFHYNGPLYGPPSGGPLGSPPGWIPADPSKGRPREGSCNSGASTINYDSDATRDYSPFSR